MLNPAYLALKLSGYWELPFPNPTVKAAYPGLVLFNAVAYVTQRFNNNVLMFTLILYG